MAVTSDLYFEIRAAIRKASQRDQYAHEIGESELATSLSELRSELERGIADIDALANHAHQWNENDYCSVCGADGRA